MKTSVCITVYNEEKSVSKLLDALLTQSTKPNEIVVVDSKSTDKTSEILRHYQKKDKRVRVLTQKTSRAEGRNLAVEIARNNTIVVTDAGCVPKKDWLERITAPFKNKSVDMVAGFYEMKANTPFQKAASVFLGVMPGDFDAKFLPSTRSVAFRKDLWFAVGGFPEKLKDTAEDTVFNQKVLESGAKIARVKDAVVEWGMPETLEETLLKMHKYARGDAQTKIFWDSNKGLTSHNVKVLFVFFRYLVGLLLIYMAINNPLLWSLVAILLIFYIFWSFRKVFIYEKDVKAALWGIVLQFTADFAVMSGFVRGIIGI